jgi:hypothetical protein
VPILAEEQQRAKRHSQISSQQKPMKSTVR